MSLKRILKVVFGILGSYWFYFFNFAMKRKVARVLITFGICLGSCLVFWLFEWAEYFELRTYDLRMYSYRKDKDVKISDRIVIVKIDQESLDYAESVGIYWPWPREFFRIILEQCRKNGARLIFFDHAFTGFGSYEIANSETESYTIQFANSIKNAGNVYLPVIFTKSAIEMNEELLESLFKRSELNFDIDENIEISPREEKFCKLPQEEIAKSAKGLCDIKVEPDDDGIFRRLPLFRTIKLDKTYAIPHAMVALFVDYSELEKLKIQNLEKGFLYIDGKFRELVFEYKNGEVKKVAMDEKCYVYPRVFGGLEKFQSISARNLLEDYENYSSFIEGTTSSYERKIEEGFFKDKIVLIGATAPVLGDVKPVSSIPITEGIVIHANYLESLLQNKFIRRVDRSFVFIAIALTCLVITLLVEFVRGAYVWRIWLTLIFAYGLFCFKLFEDYGLWMDLVIVEFAAVYTFAGANFANYMFEGRLRKHYRKMLDQYVAPDVIEDILKNPEKLKLGGEKKEMTVFFSDIESFSRMSEQMSVENLVHHLNIFLSEMSEVILKYGGTIDKFVGDAIMAFWNAPNEQKDHATRACLCALEIVQKLSASQDKLRFIKNTPLNVRIGICTGPMVVGNVGSSRKFNYSVIGDAVNMSSRLEAANKIYKTRILISKQTYEEAKDAIEARRIDFIRLTGREEAVEIYELFCKKGEIDEQMQKVKEFYEKGVDKYKGRHFSAAMKDFEQALQIKPDDYPSKVMIERCKTYVIEPPPVDWDGVFQMQIK